MTSVLDNLTVAEAPASATPSSASLAPALQSRDLWFSYARDRPVLRGVSFNAAPGRITMILGASGGGKTTLLKLLKGLIAPQRGQIDVLGRALVGAPGQGRLDPRVAYIPQQLGLVRSMTVLDNVLTGALGRVGTLASLIKLWPRDTVSQAHETLALLGIGHKAREKVYALSGGERQRVAIARALMQEPAVILADEFVSQLDPVTTVEIMEAMRRVAERGVALVMTTHELDVVERFADRVIVLRDGAKVLDCPAAEAGADDLSALIK